MKPSEAPQRTQPACRNLRCKEMFYQGQQEDEFSSGVFWCSRTHENFGPDGEPVSKAECCAGRPCYVG
jgi:hypothetical protein